MTDSDRDPWHDRCEEYRREIERTAKELTDLRDAVRVLLVSSLQAGAAVAALHELMPGVGAVDVEG